MKEVTSTTLACPPQSGLQHDCRPHLVRIPDEEGLWCERPFGQPRLTGSGHVLTRFFRSALVSQALETFLQPTPLLEARPFLWPPFKSQCNLFGSYLSPTQRLINRAESLFLLRAGRHPVFFAICERLTEESWLLSVLFLNPQSPIPAISTISETFLSATMLQNSR